MLTLILLHSFYTPFNECYRLDSGRYRVILPNMFHTVRRREKDGVYPVDLSVNDLEESAPVKSSRAQQAYIMCLPVSGSDLLYIAGVIQRSERKDHSPLFID